MRAKVGYFFRNGFENIFVFVVEKIIYVLLFQKIVFSIILHRKKNKSSSDFGKQKFFF